MSKDGIRGIVHALAQPVTYLSIAMLAFIYCGVAYLLIADRKDNFDNAVRDGKNLVRIFDQSFSHIFKSVDAALLFVRKSYQQSPASFDLATWVHDPSIRNKLIFDFTILDANGRIVDTTYSKSIIGTDRSFLESFRVQVNSAEDQLFISKPYKMTASGRHAIALTRRMTALDGTFAGVVVAFLDPSELGNYITNVDLGPNGAFALVSFDGFMYTRVADGIIVSGSIGQKLPPKTNVLKYVGADKTGHYWNSPGVIDAVSRFISYRAIESYPLTAVVGVSEAEVYRHANENSRIYLSIALLFTVAILFAIYSGAKRERKLTETTLQMQQAKDALAQANLELERRVGERTADLEKEVRQRREAQLALAQSQERYSLVESATNDGIWDWNILTGDDYLSPRWKNILGYADADLPNVEASFFELIHSDDKAAVTEAVRAHLEENRPYALDFRLRCKNGGYCWVQSRGKALRDADNHPIRMLGTITDISERKQAETLVEESRSNLTRAETMAQLGHYKFDIASNTLIWSDGVYCILGKSPKSFNPTLSAVLDHVHPDDRPILEKLRHDVMAGRDPPRITVRMIKDDGQTVYHEVWSAPIYANDGIVSGMFGTIQDVTARKQAEAAVEESRNNLERAERLALLGHYKIENGSNELTWSEGIYRILGKSPGSFTPTLNAAREFTHPDDRPALDKYRRDSMAGLELPPMTLRAVRDDGQAIYVEYWSAPIRASDGTVTGVFGTLQDVTVRKQAEAVLAQSNHELEMRVAERTTELAQEMRRREEAQTTLVQAQKMEAVGQLTAGIAHDFNNLLAVIGGSLEFVEGAAARGLTAEPELIDAALRATRRGTELVRRLLAFSRQSPLRAEPTAIDQLVLDTLRLLQRTLGQGIDMVTRLDAMAAVVSADRNQLANALLNLALNARDAMPEGGQLTISTSCQPARWAAAEGSIRWPTGEEVRITISDTGVGMTEDVRDRVFEPFFTTKPTGLGSGLGLSMVHGFVEQSGGHIEIDSAVGRGTTVTIHLPRINVACQPDETVATASPFPMSKEKTVLLVEDDPDVRVVMTAQLKQLGYKVHAVANGTEAIDLIESPTNIDVTLTDIVLPGGIDGVAIVKEAMRARPRMGVLCMSGYDPTQRHRKWLKVQNIEFLEKPFCSDKLAKALDAVVMA